MFMNKKKLALLFLTIFASKSIEANSTNTHFQPTTFYLVRHGQTDWNVQKKIQGHADISLNDAGRKEASLLKEKIKNLPITVCFASDLKRAYETAEILTAELLLPIQKDQRLRERNYGPWEGHLTNEYFTLKPEERIGTESNESIRKRVFELLQEIANNSSGDSVLLVTHGGVIRNMLIQILNLDCTVDEIEAANGAILQLAFIDGQWTVQDFQGIKFLNKQNK